MFFAVDEAGFWVHINISHCIVLWSVLWRCWLGGRKGIRPVKNFEWCSTGMVICLERDADLHMAQLMPVPLTVSCFSKIQIAFTFLVSAHPGSPGKRAVKRVCVWSMMWLSEPCLHHTENNMPAIYAFCMQHSMPRVDLCGLSSLPV